MHFDDPTAAATTAGPDAGPWYRGLTRYHWFVLLVAALGCNIAWGLIDACFYLITATFEREQFRRLGRRMREVPDTAAAAALLSARFDELLAMGLEASERGALYERLARNIRANAPMSGKLADVTLVRAMASATASHTNALRSAT